MCSKSLLSHHPDSLNVFEKLTFLSSSFPPMCSESSPPHQDFHQCILKDYPQMGCGCLPFHHQDCNQCVLKAYPQMCSESSNHQDSNKCVLKAHLAVVPRDQILNLGIEDVADHVTQLSLRGQDVGVEFKVFQLGL